jgi:predicted porin
MYKFSQSYGAANTAFEADLGGEYAGVSADAYYTKVRDAVGASALSAAQVTAAIPAGYSISNSVAGTIADTQTFGIMGLYNLGFIPLKLYVGFEHIEFVNPKTPLPVGFDDIGGYKLAAVNNAAFPLQKELDVYWAGAKYTMLSKLDLTVAYYGYHQNSYGIGATGGCSSTVAATCSGTEHVVSGDADYRFTKRFDMYAGMMYSAVNGGLANGYIKTTNANPTIGFRFRF